MPSSGGQSTGSSYSTSRNVNEPPDILKQPLAVGIQDLANLYQSGGAPGYYPNSTVAPQSANTQQAISMLAARGAGGSDLTRGAQSQLTDTVNGRYLDPTTNPEFQNALKASFAPQTENFMSSVLPGINSTFSASGRYGSGSHQGTVERAVTSLNRSQADAASKAGADYFNTERGRQVAGTTAAPALAAADYTDINQLGLAGQAQDDFAQSNIDADVARYNYEQNKQWDYINRYLASLNGGYPGGVSIGNSTTTGQRPQNDQTGQWIGGGMQALGTAAMFAPMMFSDERLKEDIAPIGKTHDGQNIYSYRYKGDPRRTIGLMAQEVAETHPDAVAMDPSGYLKVDYGKALGLF